MKWSRIVIVVAAVLFLTNIWGYDLWAPDEPQHAEGAREMWVDNHPFVTHLNGEINDDKPPLFFWLIILLSLPFGEISAVTARLPSILAGIGTVWLTLRMGRRMSSERTAVLAAFVCATFVMVWERARMAQIDMVLCFGIWVALSAFEQWRAGDADGRRAGLLFWTALGISVLAKWPVGLAIAMAIVFFTLLWDRQLMKGFQFAPFLGGLIVVAIFGAWALAATYWGPEGYSFIDAFRRHFFERAVSGYHHPQPWWYYAGALPPQLIPWTFVVPGAMVLAFRRRDPSDRFLLVAVLFVIALFTLSTEKRSLYVLPTFPAFALLTARFLGAGFGWEEAPPFSRKWITVGQGIFGSLLIILGLALPIAADRVDIAEFSPWMFWSLGLLLVAAGVSAIVGLVRKDLKIAVLGPAVGIACIYLFIVTFIYPPANAFKSGKAMGLAIKEHTAESRAAGHDVYVVGIRNLYMPFNFYSDGVYFVRAEKVKNPDIDELGELVNHFNQEARVFAVVETEILEQLPMEMRERMETVYTHRGSSKSVALVANRPLD